MIRILHVICYVWEFLITGVKIYVGLKEGGGVGGWRNGDVNNNFFYHFAVISNIYQKTLSPVLDFLIPNAMYCSLSGLSSLAHIFTLLVIRHNYILTEFHMFNFLQNMQKQIHFGALQISCLRSEITLSNISTIQCVE